MIKLKYIYSHLMNLLYYKNVSNIIQILIIIIFFIFSVILQKAAFVYVGLIYYH